MKLGWKLVDLDNFWYKVRLLFCQKPNVVVFIAKIITKSPHHFDEHGVLRALAVARSCAGLSPRTSGVKFARHWSLPGTSPVSVSYFSQPSLAPGVCSNYICQPWTGSTLRAEALARNPGFLCGWIILLGKRDLVPLESCRFPASYELKDSID